MAYRSEQLALYLNLAASCLDESNGFLSCLIDTPTKITRPSGNHEETQCLAMPGTLWIANNDDGDTDAQQELLDTLGIDTHDALVAHVDAYQTLVLKHHAGKLTRQNLPSGKQKYLYDLASLDGAIPDEKPAVTPLPERTANNVSYSLSSSKPPPVRGIVFIKGAYTGSDRPHGNMHAEQKLLAALHKCYSRALFKGVHVFGCKVACTTCAAVLKTAKQRLASKGVALKYEDPIAERIRLAAGLPQVNPGNIRDLDFSTYFT
ncbi:hypothetical protein [Corallococcus exercitus]|uniref:hypothetical protein n=1 Tax=Corallococcus exercitus TaxID=2316736 RepID=UPI0035D44B63